MRILVIEDEPRILGFLKLGLEAEGFAVDGAEDGRCRARAARSPSRTSSSSSTCSSRNSTGCSVLERAPPARPELPVLILSARTDLPTKLRSFELGANDYLSKPFSFDELVARVRVHAAHGRADERRSSRRALELDLARRRARVGDVVDRSLGSRVPAALPPGRPRRARS